MQPSTLEPWLNVSNSKEALQFYIKAFHATVLYTLDPENIFVARIAIKNGASFWIGESENSASNTDAPVRMILTVDDPYTSFKAAIAAGATSAREVTEEHGWLTGRIIDPFGHHWEIGKIVE